MMTGRGRVAAIGEVWRNLQSGREFKVVALDVVTKHAVPVNIMPKEDAGTSRGTGGVRRDRCGAHQHGLALTDGDALGVIIKARHTRTQQHHQRQHHG